MKIAVIGIGGIGGYYGGKLAKAMESNKALQVYFVARGAHKQAIEQKGLRLITADGGDITVHPTLVTDDFSALPVLDACYVCIKQFSLNDAMEKLREKITPNTQMIPLLNGVDVCQRIRKNIPDAVIFPACEYIGTQITAPGVVQQSGGNGIILFGKDPEHPDVKPDELMQVMDQAGIGYRWTDQNLIEIWSKFMFIAPYGLVTASQNLTFGQVLENKHATSLVKGIMAEIKAIAAAEGILLPENIIETAYEKGKNFPYDGKTSFQRDYEQQKPDERELFGQVILDLGKKHGIATPITQQVYQSL